MERARRWIHVTLSIGPNFKVTRCGQNLASVDSRDALLDKNDSAYYYDSAASKLHVRLHGGNGDWEEVRVQRLQAPPGSAGPITASGDPPEV